MTGVDGDAKGTVYTGFNDNRICTQNGSLGDKSIIIVIIVIIMLMSLC